MDIYAQNILDRYKKPRYKAKLMSPNMVHEEANHSCGDVVSVELAGDGADIQKYGFNGNGCAISMASADIIGDLLHEMEEDKVLDLTKEDIYEILGIEISMRRSKCALLSLLAIQNAILKARGHDLRTWTFYHI